MRQSMQDDDTPSRSSANWARPRWRSKSMPAVEARLRGMSEDTSAKRGHPIIDSHLSKPSRIAGPTRAVSRGCVRGEIQPRLRLLDEFFHIRTSVATRTAPDEDFSPAKMMGCKAVLHHHYPANPEDQPLGLLAAGWAAEGGPGFLPGLYVSIASPRRRHTP
jgi:hypothetical protein